MVTSHSRNDAAKSKVCEDSFALLRGSGCHFGDVCLARSFVLAFLPAAGRSGNAQEDQNRTIQPHHILVGEAADTRAELRLWNGRDLIHHQPADGTQAISLTWLNGQPKQRSIGRISGKCTHRDGIRHVETIVLENHSGTGLSRIVFTTCKRPNFSALQLVPQPETASIKS
jgi:hypothetical protein